MNPTKIFFGVAGGVSADAKECVFAEQSLIIIYSESTYFTFQDFV